MAVNNKIQMRRGTSTSWSSANPVLALGEPGFDTDTNTFKIGDGSTTWNNLEAISFTQIHENGSNVGIGTSSPAYTLQVNGSFGATTKSFRIDHPSKSDHILQYGSLESPYHGVRLTGKSYVVDGFGDVSLPYYLKDLVHDNEEINIQITNYRHNKCIWVENIDVQNDRFTVRSDFREYQKLDFFWSLTAIRKDISPLIVEQEK